MAGRSRPDRLQAPVEVTRRLRIEPEAEAELLASAEWYEAQQQGLGLELLDEARNAYLRIEAGDHGTPVPHAETEARRLPIPKFPLWVVFIEHGEDVVIAAYAHERRQPDYWLLRLRSS